MTTQVTAQVAEPPARTGTVTIERTGTTHKALLPWNLIVWDDDVTPMDFVVALFQRLFAFDLQTATNKMLEVHLTGRSIVYSGPKEQCEYYAEMIGKAHMTASIEEG